MYFKWIQVYDNFTKLYKKGKRNIIYTFILDLMNEYFQ